MKIIRSSLEDVYLEDNPHKIGLMSPQKNTAKLT